MKHIERGFLLLVLVGSVTACFARTPGIRPDPRLEGSASVATLEKVSLGGVDQWILIRGRDTRNPVLLWLHGGPGSSQMPVSAMTRDLEEWFVVVHWDQRGAGKSNRGRFDESTMTVQQFIDDAHELTTLLKHRFEQDRIYVLGHSWGTQLGLLLVRDHPADYHAYIGVSQLVHRDRSQEIAHATLTARIAEAGHAKDAARLKELGDPPYRDHAAYVRFVGMFERYGGNMDVPVSRLARTAILAPEYTARDLMAWRRGAIRGSGPMWNEPRYQHFDAFEQIPRLEVPAYFFQGVHDLNTPVELTVEYAEALDAQARRVVHFDASAHAPFFREREKFILELRRVRAEIEGAAISPAGSHAGSEALAVVRQDADPDPMGPLDHHGLGPPRVENGYRPWSGSMMGKLRGMKRKNERKPSAHHRPLARAGTAKERRGSAKIARGDDRRPCARAVAKGVLPLRLSSPSIWIAISLAGP